MRKLLLCTLVLQLSVFSFAAGTSPANKELEKMIANSYSEEGRKISIRQAVEKALEDNVSVLNAAKTKNIYALQVKQGYSSLYPDISLNGQYSRALKKGAMTFGGQKLEIGSTNTYALGADADWLLYSGGAVGAGIEIAKLWRSSGVYLYDDVRNSVKQRVTQVAYGTILTSALVGVQQEYLDITNQHLEETRARYKQGLASDLDLLAQQVKATSIETLVIQAKNDYEVNLLSFKQLLNIDPEERITIDWSVKDLEVPSILSLEELYSLAGENNPGLKMSKLSVDMAKEQIKVERSGHMPKIRAFANYYYNGLTENGFPNSDPEQYWSSNAGLKLEIPLFQGFKVTSLVKQKELAYEQVLNTYYDDQRSLRIKIKTAWFNYNQAGDRLKANADSIEQARKNADAMMSRFRAGLASRLEVNDAILNLNTAELQYLEAAYDAFAALSELGYLVGGEVVRYEK